MFKYIAFGLTVESELMFPELFLSSFFDTSEISIKIGPMPEILDDRFSLKFSGIKLNKNEYFLDLPEVGKYYASHGKCIIIEPAINCDIAKLRLYCLSNVFAAILIQRGLIPIHSSAIQLKGKLIMFCGKSGSGKSTLLASFLSKGFTIFSDDVCVPETNLSNQILMYSSYPMMKFWDETIKRLPNLGEPHIQLRPDVNKFGFYFHEQFDHSPKQPVMVFFLEKSDKLDQVELQEIKGYKLFQYLESNAYRGEYLGAFDIRQEHFDLFSNLANQLNGFIIKRPVGEDSIDYITDLVFEKINQQFPNE